MFEIILELHRMLIVIRALKVSLSHKARLKFESVSHMITIQ